MILKQIEFHLKTPLAGLAVGSLWPTKDDTVAQQNAASYAQVAQVVIFQVFMTPQLGEGVPEL